MRQYYLQVISTKREINSAYVARSYSFELGLNEVTLEDKWFNTEVELDWVEKKFRCKFDDGDHPYVGGIIYIEKEEDW
jgi:hypothetical protein